MRTRKHILLAVSCLLVPLFLPSAVSADESKDKEGASLDSMWIDQEAPTIDKENEGVVKGNPAAVASAGGVSATVAPMCSFEDFRANVGKGAWPGLGPFKSSANDISEFTDQKQNRLKLNVKSEQVTAAQLGLGKLGSGNVPDFLDIEMSTDFLLEFLGAKPRKIAEFNKQLEKNKAAIKAGAHGVSLAAGRYQVAIDRSKSAQGYSCLIAVNSLDANKNVLAAVGGTSNNDDTGNGDQPRPENKHPLLPALIKKPGNLVKPKPSSTAINPTVDPKREEFVAAIKTWQQVKKAALKKRDASHLQEILSGVALNKQTTAVKWLQSHGNYYDMEPRACIVDKYTDLGGGKKYSVIAQVREFSKYIREADNSVLKEVDDKYTVNYTIERVGDKWMISDSSVVTTANGQTPGQTAKVPAKTH